MVVKALEENVIAILRSSSGIESVTQCVIELVLNSLDAKSTAIAARLNLSTFHIQIIDNGQGISRHNLEFVGQRYMTNKCHTLSDLKKNIKQYGYKGEALANIVKLAKRVNITSRQQNSDETFCKIIEKDTTSIQLIRERPSYGTTVTIEGFLSSLPVRQRCVKISEFDNIKKHLERLTLIHPRVSFSVRNELTGKIVLDSRKCTDIVTAFINLHPEISNEFTFYKVVKKQTSVEGLLHKQLHENKRLQYLYVNKRVVNCSKIQDLINFITKNAPQSSQKNKHSIFVIHIKCPYSEVDLILKPEKTVVFFKHFDVVKRCLEKMMTKFLGIKHNESNRQQKEKAKSEFGLSLIGGAIKAFGNKRKSEDHDDEITSKSPKIIDDTPCAEKSPKKITHKTKLALPIEITRNTKQTEQNFNEIKDNSIFTNFPDNEKTGKGLIMDLFMMSVQAFPSQEDNIHDADKDPVIENNSKTPSPKNSTIKSSLNPSPVNDKMISVGIQAQMDTTLLILPRKSLTKSVSDYDFDYSKRESTDSPFKFPQNNDSPDLCEINQTKKLFDFGKSKDKRYIFSHAEQTFLRPNCNQSMDTTSLQSVKWNTNVKMTVNKRNPVKMGVKSGESPYFCKKSQKDLSSIKHRNSDENSALKTTTWKLNEIETAFSKKENNKKKVNETVSHYFTPLKKSNRSKQSDDIFSPLTNLIDTDKKLKLEEKVNSTQLSNLWLKDVNTFGTTVYTNRKTGVNLLKMPEKDQTFEIAERFDFIPKGLSPILKDFGKVDNLSPESKENFHQALLKSYNDELLVVKWRNYTTDKDPRQFFDEIYLEKSRLIEAEIPNISKNALNKQAGQVFEKIQFTKDIFENIDIIGQVDCKFIAVIEKRHNLLLLFDQHAVHERVRLEELSRGYTNTSTKIDRKITIFIPQNDLPLIKKQSTNLNSLGLVFDFFPNGLNISEVPLCIYNKSKKGVSLVELVENLMKEIIDTLKNHNGILVNTPRLIQNIVNSEACRGAIKFGDKLTRNESFVHLKELAKCTLPFQCAHGRPTLTPLISLKTQKNNYKIFIKPNLAVLKL